MGPQFEWIDRNKAINMAHVVVADFGQVMTADDGRKFVYVYTTVTDGPFKCYEPYIEPLRRAVCDLIGGAG